MVELVYDKRLHTFISFCITQDGDDLEEINVFKNIFKSLDSVGRTGGEAILHCSGEQPLL